MGKLVFFVFVFISFCFSLVDAATIYNSKSKEWEIDLGEVASDTVVTRTIRFEDQVKSAVASCECVRVKVSEKRRFLRKPEYILEIKFDSKGYKDEVNQYIDLLDKDNKLQKIKIRAFVFSNTES